MCLTHARTLLRLTYQTDRALREGRLGAEEWFAFVSDLESLARKIENRAPQKKGQENNRQVDNRQAKDQQARFPNNEASKEGRVLSFPAS